MSKHQKAEYIDYVIDFGHHETFADFKPTYMKFMNMVCKRSPSQVEPSITALDGSITFPVPGILTDEEIKKYNLSNGFMVAWIEPGAEEQAHKAAKTLGIRLIKLEQLT